MVQNDTRAFDLMMLAPVIADGWVLLGEVGAYVRVSRVRFEEVSMTKGLADGISVRLSGAPNEKLTLTALEPTVDDWLIHMREVTLKADGTAVVDFP